MQEFKVGIVGCGLISQAHLDAWSKVAGFEEQQLAQGGVDVVEGWVSPVEAGELEAVVESTDVRQWASERTGENLESPQPRHVEQRGACAEILSKLRDARRDLSRDRCANAQLRHVHHALVQGCLGLLDLRPGVEQVGRLRVEAAVVER